MRVFWNSLRIRFQNGYNGYMAENLIKSFKASMTFKNLDFNDDKATQYSALRETMTTIYCDDETLFGFIEAPNWCESFG